jgi:hypothetical protein
MEESVFHIFFSESEEQANAEMRILSPSQAIPHNISQIAVMENRLFLHLVYYSLLDIM